MFSPSVSLPLTNCLRQRPRTSCTGRRRTAPFASNFVASSGCHQFSRLPSASNCAPWSSKPCVSSWPITMPMPPMFAAMPRSAPKNGGCRMPAGSAVLFVGRLVVGVDRVRVHLPLAAIDRLARLREHALRLERRRAQLVAGEVVALDRRSRRRATCRDSRPCGRSSRACRCAVLLRRVAHPVELAELLAHHLDDRVDERRRGLLRAAGKYFADVLLAEQLAERVLRSLRRSACCAPAFSG